LRLGGRGDDTLLLGLDLVLADAQARAITAPDPALPRSLRPDLHTQGLGADTLALHLGQELIPAQIVLLGHVGNLLVDLLVGLDELHLLFFFDALELLQLQVFVDQADQSLTLELREIVLCRLDAGRRDQQSHPLGEVVGRDDVVIDHRSHRLGQTCGRGGRGRRSRRLLGSGGSGRAARHGGREQGAAHRQARD
jgi:hypothetical protein